MSETNTNGERTSNRLLTLGEQRCHISFNPSKNSDIDNFKRMCAEAIDFLNDHKLIQEEMDGEKARCYAEAMTCIETAQMYGVKAITKSL